MKKRHAELSLCGPFSQMAEKAVDFAHLLDQNRDQIENCAEWPEVFGKRPSGKLCRNRVKRRICHLNRHLGAAKCTICEDEASSDHRLLTLWACHVG